MPLLRFQLACARRARSMSSAFVAAIPHRIRASRRADAGPQGALDLLRRRHALADAAGRPCRRSSTRWRQAWTLDRRRRDHAGGQSRPASKPGVSAAIAPPASIALSIGVQALNDADLKALGRRTRRRRGDRGGRRSRAAIFPRTSFDLIYARPGQTPAAWRARTDRGDGARRRASVALPADHRARHDLRAAVSRRQARDCPTRTPARALWDATQEIAEGARHAGL